MLTSTNRTIKWLLVLIIVLVNISIYQWTIKEKFMGDALMHLADDTQINNIGDVFKTFYLTKNPSYNENYRIEVMHRPVFNELLVTFQKKLVGQHYELLRWISLTVQVINSIIFYYFLNILTQSVKRSFLGTMFFSLNPVFFYGLYEFGLSFSLWLTLFVSLTFIFFTKYIQKKGNIILLIGGFFFFFLALFTKESALTLQFALIIYTILLRKHLESKNSKWTWRDIFNKKIIYLSSGLILISAIYMFTRIIKLGSLLEVHAGIGASLTFYGVVTKLVGYYLLAFNIPTPVIPGFMALPITSYSGVIIILCSITFLIVNYLIVKNILKLNLMTIAGLLIFTILLIPVFKVSRNAPYYLDIPLIGVVISIVTLEVRTKLLWLKKHFNKYYVLIVILPIIFNVLFQYKTTNNMVIWLTKGEKYASQFIDSVKAAPLDDFNNKDVFLMTSFFSSDEYYIFHHAKIGSSFYYNLPNYHSEVDIFKQSEFSNLSNATLVDFYSDKRESNSSSDGLVFQHITNIQDIKMIKKYNKENVIDFDVEPKQLIEIKGKFNNKIDYSSLRALYATFTKQDGDSIQKFFTSYNVPSPVLNGNEFSIYTMIPYNAVKFTLDTTDISNSFDELNVRQYNVIESNKFRNLDSNKQLLKNVSFEDGTRNWVGLSKEQLRTDAKSGKYAVKLGPGPHNVPFQSINVVQGQTLIIDAWIKSAIKFPGVGRLQVNWIDEKGKLINVFIHTVNADDRYRNDTTIAKVPLNAAKALIYISPHDEKSELLYDDVKVYEN